jgi:hypothetical protein
MIILLIVIVSFPFFNFLIVANPSLDHAVGNEYLIYN